MRIREPFVSMILNCVYAKRQYNERKIQRWTVNQKNYSRLRSQIKEGMASFLCLLSTGSAALGADGGRCKTIDNLSIAFTFFTLVLFNSYFSCEDIIFCFCYLPEPFFYQERMMLDRVIPVVPDELIVIIFFLFWISQKFVSFFDFQKIRNIRIVL